MWADRVDRLSTPDWQMSDRSSDGSDGSASDRPPRLPPLPRLGGRIPPDHRLPLGTPRRLMHNGNRMRHPSSESQPDPVFLSEPRITVGPNSTYLVTLAAPNAKQGDLHYRVDAGILIISNSDAPLHRETLTYTVDSMDSVPVYAYPSLQAPIIGIRRSGQRLRGFAPCHFWVNLLMGEGWIRLEPGAGCRCSLSVLGRPPLDTDASSSSRGFARYQRLPPDAEPYQATATLRGGFFTITIPRLAKEAFSGCVSPEDEARSRRSSVHGEISIKTPRPRTLSLG